MILGWRDGKIHNIKISIFTKLYPTSMPSIPICYEVAFDDVLFRYLYIIILIYADITSAYFNLSIGNSICDLAFDTRGYHKYS